jgi:hypothetical protein
MNNKHGPKKGMNECIRQLVDVTGKTKTGRHKRGMISLIDEQIVNRLTSEITLE